MTAVYVRKEHEQQQNNQWLQTARVKSVSLTVQGFVLGSGTCAYVVLVMMTCFHFQLAKDLLHPTQEDEKRKCKLKRLVQSPNSYFMDVKCPGMYSGRFFLFQGS